MRSLIIGTAVILCGILASSALAIDPNLVAWYTFDEGSGTTAHDLAKGYNGTINGATWTAGKVGGALSFDGVNDYIIAADNPALKFSKSDSFTICSWVKPTSGWGEILGKMQANNEYGLFTYEIQWSEAHQSFDVLLCNSGNYYKYFLTPDNLAPAGSWHHIATVYQNKNLMVYIDGGLVLSDYFNSDPTGVSSKNMEIGVRAYNYVTERYFNGSLDDIRIYNRALTADEIKGIPEPTTLALLGLGGFMLRKRKA